MNTVKEVMTELENKSDEQTRKTFSRHDAPKNMFGVKVAELKIIAKKIKGRQDLACELYESGNPDAQYLAGIVADGSKMTKKQLESWAKGASWHMVGEYTVPWVATESPHARELAMKWIKSKDESIASTGWCTYAGIVATQADDDLDLAEIEKLLNQVAEKVHDAPNRVRYVMNGFVIAVGSYIKLLLKKAKAVAKKIGVVNVDMGGTACKVPLATAYIEKVVSAGRVGKKRKTIKC